MRTDERLKVIYETIAPTITRTDEAWKDYCRSATGENNALQEQHDASLRCATDHDLTVVGESSDIGSGLKYDHAGLMEMLDAVKIGLVSTVIVKDISRIGRNPIKTFDLIENEIEAYGAKLLCYSDLLFTKN
jgi:DNA invertase Pin-like site-specific DNA recombinase